MAVCERRVAIVELPKGSNSRMLRKDELMRVAEMFGNRLREYISFEKGTSTKKGVRCNDSQVFSVRAG